MALVRTIVQIAILWVYYLIGTAIVEITNIIVPGSIVGLILLWLSLRFKIVKVSIIERGASFLLSFLTLFFIPATVAIINYPELLTKVGLFLIGSVIISTIFVLIFTGKITQWVEKKEKGALERDAMANRTYHH